MYNVDIFVFTLRSAFLEKLHFSSILFSHSRREFLVIDTFLSPPHQAPIQNLADNIAGYFVPVVSVLSLTTLVAWVAVGYADVTLVDPDFDPQGSSPKSEVIFQKAFQVWICYCHSV